MNDEILKNINTFSIKNISIERKNILQPLINYIQKKVNNNETIRLNFICTHNSRRSHLSQIWAQTMAFQFGINNTYCYSGGTDVTEIFPKIIETLTKQGFQAQKISNSENPVYTVKYAKNEMPITCFSKVYNNDFNPKNNFGAIMTCDNADIGCPVVLGADERILVKYSDPKEFDETDLMAKKYTEKSLEIGEELYYVFSSIRKTKNLTH